MTKSSRSEMDNPPKEFKSVFMEKFFCFKSKYHWEEILKISTERLILLGCECKTEKFSLQCMFYNEERCVIIPFHVNIYTSRSSNEEYVVEIQKRCSGDTFEFIDLYANFIQQDEGFGMVVRSKIGPFFTHRQAPSLMASPFGPVILSQDTLDCLMYHLKSDDWDVRIEGVSTLAKCVQTEANRVLMYQHPSIVSVLTSLLDVDYDKIAYPTLIIFKFLLKTDGKEEETETLPADLCEQLASKLGGLLAKKLKDKMLSGKIYIDLIISVVELLEKRLPLP